MSSPCPEAKHPVAATARSRRRSAQGIGLCSRVGDPCGAAPEAQGYPCGITLSTDQALTVVGRIVNARPKDITSIGDAGESILHVARVNPAIWYRRISCRCWCCKGARADDDIPVAKDRFSAEGNCLVVIPFDHANSGACQGDRGGHALSSSGPRAPWIGHAQVQRSHAQCSALDGASA